MIHHLYARVAPLALLVGLVATTGCVGQGTATESGTGSAEAATQQGLNAPTGVDKTAGRGHGRGGPQMMFISAIKELDLSADQRKTIDGLIDGMKPEAGNEARPDPSAFFQALQDDVRAGKVDEAALNAKLAALGDPNKGPQKMAAAFQTLHDTLTPDQRTKLVASIQAKMDAHEKDEGAHHDREEAREGKDRPVAPFLRGIDLRDDQKTKIEQALASAGMEKPEGKARFEEMRDKMKSSLEAFKADKFDAVAAMPNRGEGPGQHLAKMVKAMAIIVPILDEAQRTKLADNLAKGPMMGHGRGMHHEAPNE